jgi:hypothetical protein
MRKWDALRRACGACLGTRKLLSPILFHTKGHDTLSAKRDVDDIGTSDYVDCFVGVLGDVISAASIVLDEDMVHWVIKDLLDMFSNEGHGLREGQERRRFVRWVTIYWKAVQDIAHQYAQDSEPCSDFTCHRRQLVLRRPQVEGLPRLMNK